MVQELEVQAWEALLERLGVEDSYYTAAYSVASAELTGGTPRLLHLARDGGDVVFPVVVRDDPTDVVTPYGYGGPLGVGDDPPLSQFPAAYETWCAARGVVTSFAVFHPLFAVEGRIADGGFHTAALAGTVGWSLEPPDLLAVMHKNPRGLIKRARSAGFTAEVQVQPRDVGTFVEHYEATMRRASASDFYFFGERYWQALLRVDPLLQVTVRDPAGEPVASVLGMGAPPYLHYHLDGSADAARGTGASQLGLFTLAEWGQRNGYTVLHLGGGVGGRDDSLLAYKRRFAPGEILPARIGKAVHDHAAYTGLTGSDTIDWDAFFPAYREPR